MFTIVEIKHGWFIFKVPPEAADFCASNYLDYDFLKELLLALEKLSKVETGTEYVAIEDEPAACILILKKKTSKITMQIYPAKRESFALNLADLGNEPLLNCFIEETYNFETFGRKVIKETEIWQKKLGEDGFEKHWFSFPKEELEVLKKQIQIQ